MRIFAISTVLAMPAVGHAKPIEDTQIWASIAVSGAIKGNIVFAGDVQSRIVNGITRYGQSQLRGAVGVKLDPNVSLFLGFLHADIERDGIRNSYENRAFQQLSWKLGNALGGTFATRIRLEERWFRVTPGTSLRYRQQLRYQHELRKNGPALFAGAEVFFNLNSIAGGPHAGFDQLRGLAGVSVPLSKTVAIDAAYQPTYVKGATRDRFNHVIPITLSFKF